MLVNVLSASFVSSPLFLRVEEPVKLKNECKSREITLTESVNSVLTTQPLSKILEPKAESVEIS